jgi:hypothetical protein
VAGNGEIHGSTDQENSATEFESGGRSSEREADVMKNGFRARGAGKDIWGMHEIRVERTERSRPEKRLRDMGEIQAGKVESGGGERGISTADSVITTGAGHSTREEADTKKENPREKPGTTFQH